MDVRYQYLVCGGDSGDRMVGMSRKMSCVELLERVACNGTESLWCGRSRVDEREVELDPSKVYRLRSGGLMGGKGGFGAMLRSMGKRSNQTTQDFGACRDLQGRRLRRVNDEIALERWHQARSRKEQSGKGWHLGVPSWAEVPKARKSKASVRKDAARRSWRDEEAAALESGAETKSWMGRVTMVDSLRHGFCVVDGDCYVPFNVNCDEDESWIEDPLRVGDDLEVSAARRPKGRNTWSAFKARRIRKVGGGGKVRAKREAVVARHAPRWSSSSRGRITVGSRGAEEIEQRMGAERSNVLDAVAAGIEAAKRARLRKLEEKKVPAPMVGAELSFSSATKNNSEEVLVGVLSGSARLYGRIVRGCSQFCTVSADSVEPVSSGKRYYEAKLVTCGVAQVGWASAEKFVADDEEGDGVGDDPWSWGFDGCRRFAWTNGKATQYGGDEPWKVGDVVGCCLDADARSIEFTRNGTSLGVAFATNIPDSLVPAISLEDDEAVEVALDAPSLRHLPAGYRPIAGPPEEEEEEQQPPHPEESSAAASPLPAPTSPEPAPPATASSSEPCVADPPSTQRRKPPPPAKKIQPEPLANLASFSSIEELEALGLDRLKAALAAEGCKCGGTLRERASRLFSIKGKKRDEWDPKVLAPSRPPKPSSSSPTSLS